ncbi:hypothetical protein PN499_01370 [Kamptonema animale CS-326]|nr:hypothetical protein [Kamptonema animale CS-326]
MADPIVNINRIQEVSRNLHRNPAFYEIGQKLVSEWLAIRPKAQFSLSFFSVKLLTLCWINLT